MGLKVGDKVPDFKSQTVQNGEFDTKQYFGKQMIVFYFYPKDETPGCTAQACSFRDQYQDFRDLGVEVVGISSDSIASHKEFASKYKLPFILIPDENKKLQQSFGVPKALFGLLPGRVTYFVDKKGIIRFIHDSMNPTSHITKTLNFIKKFKPLNPDS
uniref:peroxiredoxin n=1 Tax=Flavobacterium sp. TaxID=239 RepID=UPI00404958AE